MSMFGPPVTLRCTQCGGYLAAPTAPSRQPAWFRCPHCGHPVAVLAPRDPPPLFTWEAFPPLYPMPALPRAVGPTYYRTVGAFLVLTTVLLAVVAVGYLWQGESALAPHPYAIAGHVFGRTGPDNSTAPLAGARVNLSGESGFRASMTTDPSGGFAFYGVPAGGITLNVTAAGYSPLQVGLLADPVYSSPAGNLTSFGLVVGPAGSGGGATIVETPFPNLESLVASLWSGGILVILAALVAALGTGFYLRRGRLSWGVAAGAAGAVAPAALIELQVATMFPDLTDLVAVASALGVVAAFMLTVSLAMTSVPEPTE
ncbi:MAG TPA: carboxypeptidase-like regulatory domain-containing protein [Thermoplasmata archaeon]|nr:carboxypeptidase-like regulatory domain-containing protein [Thermoplasmata archaeon]